MYRVDLGKKLLEKGYNPFLALAAQETSDWVNQRGGSGFTIGDILCIYGGNKEELQESWDYAVENKMLIPFDENGLYNYNYNYSVNNNYFALLGEKQTSEFFGHFCFGWTLEHATQLTTAYCCLAKMYNYQHDVKHRNYIFSMKNICDMCYIPYDKKNLGLVREYIEWMAEHDLIDYEPYKDENHPYCKLFELKGLALNKR